MQEILLIGLLILVFFGAKKIPDFMKGLGKGINEFKAGIKETKDHLDGPGKEDPTPKQDDKSTAK